MEVANQIDYLLQDQWDYQQAYQLFCELSDSDYKKALYAKDEGVMNTLLLKKELSKLKDSASGFQEAPKPEKERGFGRPRDKKGGKRPDRKKD